MTWKVADVRSAESSSDRDTASAAVVDIERGSERRRIIVELAGTAASTGKTLDARQAVQDFLDKDDPPTRFIITTHGVSAVE